MRDDWELENLGNLLAQIKGGGTPSKGNSAYWNGDIPWCSVKDMADDKFRISNTVDTISVLGLKNSSSNLIPKGTVITSTRMGLGRAFINDVDMAINQDLKALYPNRRLDNIFLLWLIIFNRDRIESLGTGSTVKGIRLETLRALEVWLPPLPTQRKIAAILSAYDDLIENNLKRIKLLEEKAQLTYEEWFVRMKFPGHESTPINKDTGLPEGWENVELVEIANVVTGKTPSTSKKEYFGQDIPFIKTPDLHRSTYMTNVEEHLSFLGAESQKNKFFPKNTTLLACIGAGAGAVGLTSKLSQCNQQINGILTKVENFTFYIFLFSKTLTPLLRALGSNGATMTNVSKGKLERITILKPSSSVIELFHHAIKNLFDTILIIQNQNQLLKEARDILLPRLMTGIIDVDSLDLSAFEQGDQVEMLMAAEGEIHYVKAKN